MDQPLTERLPGRPPARPRTGFLLALCLALASLAQGHAFAHRWDAFDFYQFWLVGQEAHVDGVGNVWSQPERERLGQQGVERALTAERAAGTLQNGRPTSRHGIAALRRQTLETYSTPWLYTLFGVSASGHYARDLDRFQLAGLLGLAAAVMAWARLLGGSWTAALLWLAFATTFFAPALSDVRVGNVNRLQLLALTAATALCARARRPALDVAAGVLFGLAATFKPNLAFPIATLAAGWIAFGRWRKLFYEGLGCALGAAAAFGLSSAWFGDAGAWRDWRAALSELMGQYDHAIAKGNFSLPKLLGEYVAATPSSSAAWFCTGAFVGVLWAARRERSGPADAARDALDDLRLAALGGVLSLLTAKLAWLHYFLLALPLALVLLRPGARAALALAGAAGLLLVAFEPFKDLLRLEEGDPTAAFLVCGGALILYVAALFDLARPRAASA